MATKVKQDVKVAPAAAVGESAQPKEGAVRNLADGAAMIQSILDAENAAGAAGRAVEGQGEVDLETGVEEGAGAPTEAAGSGSESNAQEETEGESAEDGGLRTELGEGTEGAEAEAEGEEGAEGLDPELTAGQESVNRRIGELTAKRKEAEEKLAAATDELTELKARFAEVESGEGRGASPKGYLPPIERIDAVRKAREAVSQAEATAALTGELLAGEPEAALAAVRAAGVKVVDGDGAVAYLRQLQSAALKAGSKAEARLAAVEFNAEQVIAQERTVLSAQARASYPWLNNRGSQERQLFDNVAKAYPFLRDDPAFDLAIGDMVTGAMARQAKATKARTEVKGLRTESGNGTPPGAAARGAQTGRLIPQLPGKPRAVSGAGTVRGGDGGSIRDQALKDPSNEGARLRYLERMAV